MSFRFFRRVKIAPGISLNFSKTGMSMSLGPRGLKYTIGTSGQRATVGIPGTGIFYSKKLNSAGSRTVRDYQPSQEQERLTPGFFKRLFTPRHELDFIEGMKAFVSGDSPTAYQYLSKHLDQPDAACVAGVIALNQKRWDDAAAALMAALSQGDRIGEQLERYGLQASVQIMVSEHVEAQLPMKKIGVELALVEVWQTKKEYQKAADLLMTLREELPHDVVIKLSLAELILTTEPANREFAKEVVKISEDMENESEIHAALLLYRAKALRILGLHKAAKEILSRLLRKKTDRSPELMREIRYIRALTHEALGENTRARTDLETIYAEDSEYEDVAQRLGIE